MYNAVRKLSMEDTDETLISIRTAAKRQFWRNTRLPCNIDSGDGVKSVESTSMAVNSPGRCRVNDAGEQYTRKHTRHLRADATQCWLIACSHFTDSE
jgi:hypothetical protein